VVTGKDVFLTSSSALPPYYTYCTGVAAYDMAGEPLFSLFPGKYVGSLVTDGPYAYARLANEPGESGPLRVTVIELSTGKVVTRAQVPGELLAELNAHRY
jgi:hypothetical protein